MFRRLLLVLGLLICFATTAAAQIPQSESAVALLCPPYTVGAQLSSGAIPVTSSAGALVTGLTIGQWYAIETTSGPWYASPNIATPYYGAWVSNNGGTTWYRLNSGADGYDFTNYWGAAAEVVNTNYRRGYWQATTTSIRIQVADNRFDDNSGSLSWKLYSATRCN